MSTPKYLTEVVEEHGLRFEPLREEERTTWFTRWGDRVRGMEVPADARRGPTRCVISVSRGRGTDSCSRDAVAVRVGRHEQRYPVCAQHMAGLKRRARNDVQRHQEWEAERLRKDAFSERVGRLAERLEVLLFPGTATLGSVTVEDLELLADRLEGKR